jgi:SAM-dependent methyltransferase
MVNVDFGRTVADYRHRAAFPDELFDRLARWGVGQGGQRVLDLGTGTGIVARNLARRGCEVVGLDPSERLIEEAKRLDAEAGVRVDYVVATAERTMLDEKSFDVVTVGDSWAWFDRPKAMREVKRVLRPGGRLVLACFDWVPLPGNAVDATEQLIEKYNPEWTQGGGTGMYPSYVTDLRIAGFREIETFSFDVVMRYSHEVWRGRVRASGGVQASLSPDMVARFDENLRGILAERFRDEPLQLPHCVWALCGRAPG